jgi:sugar/nucleoside kinase (ribokinase family)
MQGWLAQADIALVNEVEAQALAGRDRTEDAAELLAARLRPEQVLVVKQGENGASAWRGGRRFHAAAPKVKVIDTVGAGDTFNAGFLAAMAQGAGPAVALAKGVQAASRAISTTPRRYGP